jgi:hypothetical protein
MIKVKVKNMVGNSGLPVRNQFIIKADDGVYFQSYETVIARNCLGAFTLDDQWDYSRTTSKYLYRFTGLDRKQILKGIKDGSIKVENLN